MNEPVIDRSSDARANRWLITLASCAILGCHQPEPSGLTQVNELSNPARTAPDSPPPNAELANISVPAAASPPEDGQWTMPARDYANTRFSGLDEINTENVGKLQRA